MAKKDCPCGFDCSMMDVNFRENKKCANNWRCHNLAEPWDLPYEYDSKVLTVLGFQANIDSRTIEEAQEIGWAAAEDIPYEVINIKNYPPIFVSINYNYEWRSKKYGFAHLNNWTWFLWLIAKEISFDDWNDLFYRLRSAKALVRINDYEYFEQLRCLTDKDYADIRNSESDDVDSIPF